MRNRKIIQGYTDMGKPLIPQLPMIIGLTHRTTGVVNWLNVTGTYPSLTISLGTTAPADYKTIYGPFDGPVVNLNYRLYVSISGLAVELTDKKQSSGRVFARNYNFSQALEITAPGGVLTYTNIQL